MNPAFLTFLSAATEDRRDAFLGAARRLGTAEQNVEKDFWVCWTLDALFNSADAGGPRLLFKGGTSLSKAFGLISRFSEDIDITIFRDDLGHRASVEELEALSGKKRRARLDAIKPASQAHVREPMRSQVAVQLREAVQAAGLQPAAARIELDPDRPAVIRPYVADEVAGMDLSVANVTTVVAERTFWDKAVILHGLRQWFEKRGVLRGGGQRVSRHYYDIYRLLESEAGRSAANDLDLAADCVRHARMFFNSPGLNLATAAPGSFTLSPNRDMAIDLARDYSAMSGMIFGEAPPFGRILERVADFEADVNAAGQTG